MDLIGFLGSPTAELQADPELSGHLSRPERIEGRTHVVAPALGVGFVDHGTGHVSTIHIHCDASADTEAYVGELPSGLSRQMTLSEVRSVLGEPQASGERVTMPVLGSMPPWDRFLVAYGLLHVSYRSQRRGISLVTIMSRDVAPSAQSHSKRPGGALGRVADCVRALTAPRRSAG